MRIDGVEKMWQDLEGAFAQNGKIKDRRKFAEVLVYFNGQKGAVAGLESALKIDLADDADAIARYNAICNMLEAAEDWLLHNDSEINDLNDWVISLGNKNKLDMTKLQVWQVASDDNALLSAIHNGYVVPGKYGKMEEMTFPQTLDGYYFIASNRELAQALQDSYNHARNDDDNFNKTVLHIIYEGCHSNALVTPCVFVRADLLKSKIQKYKKSESIKKQITECIKVPMIFNLDYDYGIVNVSTDTKIPVYVVRG